MTGWGTDPTNYMYKGYRNKICRDRIQAIRGEFAGGLNYVPFDQENMIDDAKSEPDWDSIMLCEFSAEQIRVASGTDTIPCS